MAETPIWTEGVCGDGAVILRDGLPVTIQDVVTALNKLEYHMAWRREEDEILHKLGVARGSRHPDLSQHG